MERASLKWIGTSVHLGPGFYQSATRRMNPGRSGYLPMLPVLPSLIDTSFSSGSSLQGPRGRQMISSSGRYSFTEKGFFVASHISPREGPMAVQAVQVWKACFKRMAHSPGPLELQNLPSINIAGRIYLLSCMLSSPSALATLLANLTSRSMFLARISP
jgi:hypothetical protein